MPTRIRSVPTTVLAAIALCLVSATTAHAQTTLLDVQTSGGDTVATVRSDSMRLNVPLHVLLGGIVFPDGSVQTTAASSSTVTTAEIEDGTILDADVSKSAAIKDTKLATISTAGKVENSATTATDQDTPNAIVARDGKGGFAAGDVTLTGAGGFVAEGTYEASTSVDPPLTGAGTRMMWYPEKAAFRAGRVDGTQWNRANVGDYSTATGYSTTASGERSVAMGHYTTASGYTSTAIGSGANASGSFSVALGVNATAGGTASTALGSSTTANGDAAMALGYSTDAGGNYSTALGFNTTASGGYSLATGDHTTASAAYSTAMGTYASTGSYAGSFVYGDAATTTNVVTPTASNQFVVRATGGTDFYSSWDLSTGVSLAAGSGSWSSVSDEATKTDFRPVDGETVLEKIRGMRILEWSYMTQDTSIRHLGPTAQDFHAAFGLGENNTTISVVDADGVNMLAIQALAERTRALRSDNQALHDTNAALRDELADTRQRLTDAERRLARVEALLERLAASERE